jgi:hypothetical protein
MIVLKAGDGVEEVDGLEEIDGFKTVDGHRTDSPLNLAISQVSWSCIFPVSTMLIFIMPAVLDERCGRRASW